VPQVWGRATVGPRRRPTPDRGAVAGGGDGEQSLTHGVVVEIRLVVRLLRMPLLRLDGVIVLSPNSPAPEEIGPTLVMLADDDSSDHRLFSDGGTVGADLGEVARILAQLQNASPVRGGSATRHR